MNKLQSLSEKMNDKFFAQWLAHLSQGRFFSPFFLHPPPLPLKAPSTAAAPEFSILTLRLRGQLRREECNSPSWNPARGLATATPLFTLGRSSLETLYEIPEAARSSVLWPWCFICKYSL